MSAREQFTSQFLVKPNEYSSFKKIVAVMSGKGGVGKSLVTSLTAIALQNKGYKVGILDGDITGPSIARIFGLTDPLLAGDEGILPAVSRSGIEIVSTNLLLENPGQPIIWRSPMITSIIKQFYSECAWGDLDYLLIDMPPGTGDVPLTVFQSFPVDGVIVVSTPQDLVGMIVEKSINMAKAMEVPMVGLVENMSYVICDDCGKKIYPFGHNDNAKDFGIDTIVELPINADFARACDNGQLEMIEVKELEPLIASIEKL